MTTTKPSTLSVARIPQHIVLIRGQRVLLDADLATLYGVQTRVLVQAVKRNIDRFPEDFMFQLTWEEAKNLRSQAAPLNDEVSRSQPVILKRGANIKYPPYVFTEQGVAMLSSVLRSPQALAVNIEIMRVFVRLRAALASNKELARKLDRLEHTLAAHDGKIAHHDEAIAAILSAIRELMTPATPTKKRKIGFVQEE